MLHVHHDVGDGGEAIQDVVRRGPQPTKTGAIMLITNIAKSLRFTKIIPQLSLLRLIYLTRGTTGWPRLDLCVSTFSVCLLL